jgi:hypothetical protein
MEQLSSTKIFQDGMNKKFLFEHLDNLRKNSPADYSKFVDAHEDDLRAIGYFK